MNLENRTLLNRFFKKFSVHIKVSLQWFFELCSISWLFDKSVTDTKLYSFRFSKENKVPSNKGRLDYNYIPKELICSEARKNSCRLNTWRITAQTSVDGSFIRSSTVMSIRLHRSIMLSCILVVNTFNRLK